jgi:hypothetical protein
MRVSTGTKRRIWTTSDILFRSRPRNIALAPCCPEHASNASRSTDYAVRFFQLDRPDESSGAGDARSRSSAGLDEGVVDRAADRHPKKPAVDAPPGRQEVGEVGQDAGENGADRRGGHRIGVPAVGIAIGALLAVKLGNVDLAVANEILVHQDDAEHRAHRRADDADERRSAPFPRREGIKNEGDIRAAI